MGSEGSSPQDFISGGYFLTKVANRKPYMAAELVPEKIVTISTCITAVFPNGWPTPGFELSPKDHEPRLQALGIHPGRAEEVVSWVAAHPPEPATIWPYAFTSVDLARQFAKTFMEFNGDFVLVGVALRKDLVGAFLREAREQYGGNTSELVEAIKQDRNPEPKGKILGYDIHGDGIAESHSFLCHGLETDLNKEFSVNLNPHGLIDDGGGALRFSDWIMEKDLGEHCLWLPWRLDRYELS